MDDEQKHLVPAEDEKIDLQDAWQALWWCRTLNITKTELEEATKAVGPRPAEVRRFLSQYRQTKKQP